MGTTLTLAVLSSEGWAVASVGDSFAVGCRRPGEFFLLQQEQASEFANITSLLTSREWKPEVYSGTEELESLTVATDGLEHASIRGSEPHPGFWSALHRECGSESFVLADLLAHMDARGLLLDDATLATATKLEDSE